MLRVLVKMRLKKQIFLQSVTMANSVTRFESNAFLLCRIALSLQINASLTYIGIVRCPRRALQTLTIHCSVTTIGSQALGT